MMRNCRSKKLTWWVTVAVLVWAAGYFSLESDFLGEVYAAPASSSHATADMMSPIFAVKLEHSIKGFNEVGFFYMGVAQQTNFSPVDPINEFISFNTSICLGSICVWSACLGSGCLGSWCILSNCGSSNCAASHCSSSGCEESNCINSRCTSTVCVNHDCPLPAG